MFDNRVIALRWSDNERVDVDNVKIKTYEDDPEVVAKIPKLSKTFIHEGMGSDTKAKIQD